MWLLGVVTAEVALLAALFLPASSGVHWVGYIAGSIVVPSTVFWFRRVDRSRQALAYYAAPGWIRHVPSVLLMAGVALAALHAFYLAVSKHLS